MAASALREQLDQDIVGKPVVLTRDTVLEYVKGLQLPLLVGQELEASDSSTGNLNYCFVVRSVDQGGPSVFVKQAPDFVRCLGEDAKLTTNRIRIEALAALEFSKCVPECIPTLHHFDAASCVLVMEHLHNHQLLQDVLRTGEITTAPAIAIAKFMAAVHGSSLGSAALKATFLNEALCGITNSYVFTLPFQADDSNSNDPELDERAAALRSSEPLQAAISTARARFASSKEGLIHGDLHAGSVMTDGTDGKVIDHEFAFFGPLGFDLGLFLAGYIFPFAVALAASQGRKLDAISAAMRMCVTSYFDLLTPHISAVAHLASGVSAVSIWTDALRFMGCELLRRVLGVAKRAELEELAADPATKPTKLVAERIVLNIGEQVLLAADAPATHGSIDGVDELLRRMMEAR